MPVAAMLLAALFWSSAMVGNKLLLGSLAVSEVGLARFALGAAILWLVVGLSGEWRRLGGLDRRPFLMGLLEPGMVGLLVIWGQSYTTAINAAVFWALMPLLMPVLGRLVLRERLEPVVVLAAIVGIAGTAALVWGQNAHGEASLGGDLLCLAGVLTACANQLLARRVAQTRGRPIPTSAVQLSMAACVMLAVMALIEQPAPALHRQTTEVYGLIAYMGIAGGAGPFLLYNYALRHLPVGRISLFPPLVGPLGAALAALVLGETLTVSDALAIAVIVAAVFLPTISGAVSRRGVSRRPPEPAAAPGP